MDASRTLSNPTTRIIQRVADIVIPSPPDFNADGMPESVRQGMSQLLFEYSPLFRRLFLLGIHAFEWMPFFFGFGFYRFTRLPGSLAEAYIHRWESCRWFIFREFFKGWKAVLTLVYFSDRKVWRYLGYDPDTHVRQRLELRQEILNRGDVSSL